MWNIICTGGITNSPSIKYNNRVWGYEAERHLKNFAQINSAPIPNTNKTYIPGISSCKNTNV